MNARFLLVLPLTALLFLSAVPVAFSSFDQFEGDWANIDPNTRGIVRVVISLSPSVNVRAFGNCIPNPCDWGMADRAYVYSPSVASNPVNDTQAIMAVFRFSHAQTVLIIEPDAADELSVQSFTHFIDDSGRTDYTSSARFQRQQPAVTDMLPAMGEDARWPLTLVRQFHQHFCTGLDRYPSEARGASVPLRRLAALLCMIFDPLGNRDGE